MKGYNPTIRYPGNAYLYFISGLSLLFIIVFLFTWVAYIDNTYHDNLLIKKRSLSLIYYIFFISTPILFFSVVFARLSFIFAPITSSQYLCGITK